MFEQGYAIFRANQDLIYVSGGKEQIGELLKSLFKNPEELKSFIKICSHYLIA